MEELKINIPKEINVTIGGHKEIKNHEELNNLDFENSGHTGFQKELTFDQTPTEGSENPVTSGGVYDYIAENANMNYCGEVGDEVVKVYGAIRTYGRRNPRKGDVVKVDYVFECPEYQEYSIDGAYSSTAHLAYFDSTAIPSNFGDLYVGCKCVLIDDEGKSYEMTIKSFSYDPVESALYFEETLSVDLKLVKIKIAINTKEFVVGDYIIYNGINWDKFDGSSGGGNISIDSSLSTTSENPVQNKVITSAIEEAKSIAKGRATGYVFDTVEDLDTWLTDETNVANLVLGDNLYIRATDVPDYWWDGSSKQQLETQKVDLTGYYTKTETDDIIEHKADSAGLLAFLATTNDIGYIELLHNYNTSFNGGSVSSGAFGVGDDDISILRHYWSSLIFTTAEEVSSFTFTPISPDETYYTIVLKFTGDDCNSNYEFIPSANTTYEINFKCIGTDPDDNYVISARVGAC